MARKDMTERLIDLPMAGNARESINNARINSSMSYGISGSRENFGVSDAECIAEANEYDRDGYDCNGLNIATGRSNRTKFTGRK